MMRMAEEQLGFDFGEPSMTAKAPGEGGAEQVEPVLSEGATATATATTATAPSPRRRTRRSRGRDSPTMVTATGSPSSEGTPERPLPPPKATESTQAPSSSLEKLRHGDYRGSPHVQALLQREDLSPQQVRNIAGLIGIRREDLREHLWKTWGSGDSQGAMKTWSAALERFCPLEARICDHSVMRPGVPRCEVGQPFSQMTMCPSSVRGQDHP